MGFFSSLTWPAQVIAINVGMKPNITMTIHEISEGGEKLSLLNPYLMVGKGHIRLCSTMEDLPPFTLKINSFNEFKMYGVKHYKWTIYNQSSPDPISSRTIEVGDMVFLVNRRQIICQAFESVL